MHDWKLKPSRFFLQKIRTFCENHVSLLDSTMLCPHKEREREREKAYHPLFDIPQAFHDHRFEALLPQ